MSDVVREALSQMAAQQSADGYWRTLYLGGPLHTATGLIATALLGAPSSTRFEAEDALLEGILVTQGADGSVPAYPGGPAPRATARVVELACRVFARTYASSLTSLRARRVLASAEAASRYAREGKPSGIFSELIANVMHNAVFPEEPDLPGATLGAEAAALILEEPDAMVARRWMSAFARQALPAIAILVDSNANISLHDELGTKVLAMLGLDPDGAAKRVLEQHVVHNQAKTGGWLWSVFGTSLNLLALRARGRGQSDECVERGVAFIDSLRVTGHGGRLEQSWCNAEIWDTSVASTTLLSAGIVPHQMSRIVESVLAEQQPDGLWAFGVGAREGDNDSTTMALTFLPRAAKHVEPGLRDRVHHACIRSVEALLSAQQEDGGFGYSPEPYDEPYSFGRRLPFGIETALVDASTADVTGRVMAAALGVTTFAPTALTERIHAAVERAIEFLQQSQSACGSWPGRWTSGYLSSLAFVLPPVRAYAPEWVSEPWVRRCRDFVLAHRNDDEGWGETTLADSRPEDAGEGTSTPVQTAYAAMALIASSHDGHDQEPLHGGVRYLHGAATLGQWHNSRALYTVAFREDYFDAPFMTNAMVTSALVYASAAIAHGADHATDSLILG